MGELNPTALSEGVVFHGRYQIIRCLKAGGMGAIYECVHLTTRKHRALKVMLPQVISSPDMRNRFELEARVTAEIESDHIVETFDAGVDEATGAPFLVMELLRGGDLDGILEHQGPLNAEETVALLSQVALALERTHAAGIIHRDLKPQNLFLTTRDDGSPRLKILDFGIAKVVADSTKTAQQTAAIGTPLYMAPEQATGDGTIGAPADLYALAHIAYTLLAGREYWMEEYQTLPVLGFLQKMIAGTGEPPSQRAARRGVTLPVAFDAWFARATAVAPGDRFARASTQIAELSTALGTAAPPMLLGMPPLVRLSSQADMATPQVPVRAGSQPRVGSPAADGAAAAVQAPTRPLEASSDGGAQGPTLGALSTTGPQGVKRSASIVALGLVGAVGVAALGAGGFLFVRRAPSEGGAPAMKSAESAASPTASESPAIARSAAAVLPLAVPTSATAVAPLASATASPSASPSTKAPGRASSIPTRPPGSASKPSRPKDTIGF